jgi:hypothetical protein
MVIPRFTIRILLIATAIAAVLALVLRAAVLHYEPWSIALCTTLAGGVLIFLLYIFFWTLAWIWDQTLGQAFRPPPQVGNPFASAGPPRQLVKPTEPQ